MDKEIELIKKKKLEELKKRYMNGDKKMDEENMPDKPIKVTDSDFDEHVKKYKHLVVDCWAPWCGPCHMISPVIEELASELRGKIVFGKLNVDENQLTASRFGIMSIPSLLVFKNGQLVDTIIGAMPKPILLKKLSPYIQ